MSDRYDSEAVYDLQIVPLLKRIKAICIKNNIPAITSFCYASKGDGTSEVATTATFFHNRTPKVFDQVKRELINE